MSSDSPFGLTDNEVVYELSFTFHSYILEFLAWGIYTTIYFVALYLTCTSSCLDDFYIISLYLVSRRNRPRVGSVVLMTIMWILITIHASNSWAFLDNVYIRHGKTREAQFEALFSHLYRELFPVSVTNSVVSFISILLADMTMVITHSSHQVRNHPS